MNVPRHGKGLAAPGNPSIQVHLRRTCCIGLLTAWFAGCTGDAPPTDNGVPPQASATSTEGEGITTAQSAQGAGTAQSGGLLPIEVDLGAGAEAVMSSLSSPEVARAQELFQSLLNPSSPEEWERWHTELSQIEESVLLPVLVEALESSDRLAREMASQELLIHGSLPDNILPALERGLEDASQWVQANCAVALLTQSPERADRSISALVDLLESDDPVLREMVAGNLKNFSEAVVEELPRIQSRLETAPRRIAVPLIEAIEAAGPRASAASGLLEKLSESEDPEISSAAQRALLSIGG